MMNPQQHKWYTALNAPAREERLAALRALQRELDRGRLPEPPARGDVNNHIHTTYSFSPYTPAKAVWLSHTAGLATAGIMDHDSISGAEEFIAAGRSVGLATTIGVECRCDFTATALAGRKINNPDQLSNAYVAIHGIPHTCIAAVADYFRPRVEARGVRNRLMMRRLNAQLPRALELDYERDVLPLSCAAEGGSVTERHILFALARRLVERYGRGTPLLATLQQAFGLDIPGKVQGYLADTENPHYEYDLLGALKSSLVEAFYVPATDECPEVRELLSFTRRIGAIAAYAYLGDITESVTGDKKSQEFEDGYLELLFDTLIELGFQAVTYMPNRNSPQQLERVQRLCRSHGLFEVSGVDINSPRQEFTCPELRQPQFRHLVDAAWALIGHELEATTDPSRGMFQPEALRRFPDLAERIAHYAREGRGAQAADAGP